MHTSLNDILKALKGLVVMSQELEDMSISLYNNSVPDMWASKVGNSFPHSSPVSVPWNYCTMVLNVLIENIDVIFVIFYQLQKKFTHVQTINLVK